jgi:predicted PurR-regulated permease PerM
MLPFVCSKPRYFFFAVFFAAFLAAFFAGAFLAAFLVAICLFSLFDGLHRFCNRNNCS